MRAIVSESYDCIGALTLENVPIPVVAADDVLVRIHVAGVNFADVLMVAGRYQVKAPSRHSLPSSIGGPCAICFGP